MAEFSSAVSKGMHAALQKGIVCKLGDCTHYPGMHWGALHGLLYLFSLFAGEVCCHGFALLEGAALLCKQITTLFDAQTMLISTGPLYFAEQCIPKAWSRS